ncbi:RNA ligase/cyclic nucleotide phosphodiesterase [Chaetomium sp. MPI-SDFR-AT-0129]|nr:RNA ligase/cyclic nucleotide phosphodiesterase [Chaetomium sp. MPI-SDFR-AT-0129]
MAPASGVHPADTGNKFEDFSGIKIAPGGNPYDALIDACQDSPAKLQSLYATHRTSRNKQQREKFLSSEFKDLNIDPILLRLEKPEVEPGFKDPRHCLVFWARPPDHIVKLARHLQTLLQAAAPNLWLMPPHRMHLTALEITHSRTAQEIGDLVSAMRPVIPELTGLTFTRRSRLVKPMISYDLSAVAVSFLPASGEKPVSAESSSPPLEHSGESNGSASGGDHYTYHHLRRDAFDVASAAVTINSRYVVPSAHVTLGRYITQDDHKTPEMRERWIQTIENINKWLENEVWEVQDGPFIGEWIVGQERGLEGRCGTVWYGGGRTILAGEGF